MIPMIKMIPMRKIIQIIKMNPMIKINHMRKMIPMIIMIPMRKMIPMINMDLAMIYMYLTTAMLILIHIQTWV